MPKAKVSRMLRFLREKYDDRIKERMDMNIDLYELLVTTMLSQRTKDENTFMASERLFSVVTTPEELLRLTDNEIEELIHPSGTFRRKAKRIREVSRILVEEYPSSFPRKREELMGLPGVGPKTADVVLSYGLGKPFIAVDVHVEVCSKRLGLVQPEAKYEEIRKTLESLVPVKDRYLVNLGLVNFGREICRTRNPKCPECKLSAVCDFHASKKSIKKPR
jgi:endonuclease-3